MASWPWSELGRAVVKRLGGKSAKTAFSAWKIPGFRVRIGAKEICAPESSPHFRTLRTAQEAPSMRMKEVDRPFVGPELLKKRPGVGRGGGELRRRLPASARYSTSSGEYRSRNWPSGWCRADTLLRPRRKRNPVERDGAGDRFLRHRLADGGAPFLFQRQPAPVNRCLRQLDDGSQPDFGPVPGLQTSQRASRELGSVTEIVGRESDCCHGPGFCRTIADEASFQGHPFLSISTKRRIPTVFMCTMLPTGHGLPTGFIRIATYWRIWIRSVRFRPQYRPSSALSANKVRNE